MIEDDKQLDDVLGELFAPPTETHSQSFGNGPANGPENEILAADASEPEPPPDPATDELADVLVKDYATGLYSFAEIGDRNGMTADHVRTFLGDPDLEPLIRHHRAIWMADDNQAERVRKQASMVVELGIGTLGQRLMDPDPGVSTAQRLAVFDSVAKLTGLVVGNTNGVQASGPRMAINIHISGRDAVEFKAPVIEGHALSGG